MAVVVHVIDCGETDPEALHPQLPATAAGVPELGDATGEAVGGGGVGGGGVAGGGVAAGAGAMATDTAMAFPVVVLYVIVAGLNAPAELCDCETDVSFGAWLHTHC